MVIVTILVSGHINISILLQATEDRVDFGSMIRFNIEQDFAR